MKIKKRKKINERKENEIMKARKWLKENKIILKQKVQSVTSGQGRRTKEAE